MKKAEYLQFDDDLYRVIQKYFKYDLNGDENLFNWYCRIRNELEKQIDVWRNERNYEDYYFTNRTTSPRDKNEVGKIDKSFEKEPLYIYESPNGGKTIYKRESLKIERTKIIK